MTHLLLENPWPLVIVCVALAAVVRLVGRRAARPSLTYVALAILILGGGIYALAYGVTTQREALRQRTHELVRATLPVEKKHQAQGKSQPEPNHPSSAAPLDLQTIRGLIADRATLTGPNGDIWVGAGQLKNKLVEALERNPPAGHRISSLSLDIPSPTRALAHLRLRTTFRSNNIPPTHTTWKITWQRDNPQSPWHITNAQWMERMNRPPPQLRWLR